MAILNYKEFGYKDCKEIAGLVESERPELITKPSTHYVFKIKTVDYKDKNSIEVSLINKLWAGIKVTLEDGGTGFVNRHMVFRTLTIGTDVTAKEVMAELLKTLNAAVPSMKKHKNVCTTIELLNSHIDMTDFNNAYTSKEHRTTGVCNIDMTDCNNAYTDVIQLMDQKLCEGKMFWTSDTKIMTFYS